MKTIIVIGPKKTIEIVDCLDALNNPAHMLIIDGVPSAISDQGYDYLISEAKNNGFAVFEEV